MTTRSAPRTAPRSAPAAAARRPALEAPARHTCSRPRRIRRSRAAYPSASKVSGAPLRSPQPAPDQLGVCGGGSRPSAPPRRRTPRPGRRPASTCRHRVLRSVPSTNRAGRRARRPGSGDRRGTSRRNAVRLMAARPYAGSRMTNAPDFNLDDELAATDDWEDERLRVAAMPTSRTRRTRGRPHRPARMELAERHALRRVAGLSHRARGHHRGRVPPAPPGAGRPGRRLDRGHRRGRRELDGRARPARRDGRLRGARGDLPAPADARPGDVRRPRQGRGHRARSSRRPAPTP